MKLEFALYLIMGVTSAATMALSTDEAAKYIAPAHLFWARFVIGVIDGTATTIKGFTSRTFVEWRAERRNARLNGKMSGQNGPELESKT